MTHSVGVRAYQIFVTQKGSSKFADPKDANLKETMPDFITRFVAEKATIKNISALEKNWKMTERSSDGAGNSRGLISYGRYGYAAPIQDSKTGKLKYNKKRGDSEIIDLYYRFWIPDKEKFAIAALSSFSGRSCITLIFDEITQAFC